MRLTARPRPDAATVAAAPEAARAATPESVPATRPGLPVSLFAPVASGIATASVAMRQAATDARLARETGAADLAPPTGREAAAPDTARPDTGTDATGQPAPDAGTGPEQATPSSGAAGPDDAPETATAPTDAEVGPQADAAEAPQAAEGAFEPVRAPPLPMVRLPDMTAVRAPLVPPPPREALRDRAAVLRRSGLTPEGHHAAVQQGVFRLADVARQAQRAIVAEVGSTAAGTRHAIEMLANRIPGIVAGGVARVRAEAARVRGAIRTAAEAEMQRVAAHRDRAQQGMEASSAETNLDMQERLLRNAPTELTTAREALDAALQAAAQRAGQRMRGIVNGQEPQPVSDGVTLSPAQRAEADEADEARRTELARFEHTTFAAAAVPLAGELMRERGQGQYLAQYGNLLCNGALPDLVAEQQRLYDRANQASVDALGSEDNLARFFDQTFGLTLPLEEGFKGDEENFQRHLAGNTADERLGLNTAQTQILRQMASRLARIEDETLNPDHADSLPARSIKGLHEAGDQIRQGLLDQARLVEASLKANLAQLAEAYPDVVDRLLPMVESGEFLEATAMLARLAQAEDSARSLRDGQIAAVAAQAVEALAAARDGFDRQVRSLHRSIASAVEGIARYEPRAVWDFARAATDYTGVMSEGLDTAIPMLQAHATELAQRLLGPALERNQTFDNFTTAAIRYLNGVMATEWSGYLQRVADLEKILGGVQTGAEGTAGVTGREENGDTPFRRIRDGARSDTLARANQIVNALPPRPGTAALALGYLTPFPGPIATGIVHYMTDPDESAVVTALSIPWPGPWAIHERHGLMDGDAIAARDGAVGSAAVSRAMTYALNPVSLVFGAENSASSIRGLIDERMDEPERAQALDLFSGNPSTRSAAKQALINAAPGVSGISADATMALSQSLTADEVSREAMSPTDRALLARSLRAALDPPQQEIAAAYVNNEPDLALALRLRNHHDRMRRQGFNAQMDAGQEMQAIIQAELFMAGGRGYVPQATLDRLRDEATIRMAALVGDPPGTVGARPPTRITVAPEGPAATPRVPLTPGQIPQPRPDRGAGTASPAPAPGSRAPIAPHASAPTPRPDVGADRTSGEADRQRTKAAALRPPTVEEATERAATLAEARNRVIAHLNRPTVHTLAPGNRGLERSVERHPEIGVGAQARQRRYDPVTGRYEIAPAEAVQTYNRALILHGPDSAEARAAQAVAEMRRAEAGRGGLSTNDLNRLHDRLSDTGFAAMRARWIEASPRERRAMAPQWREAQREHARFLQLTAEGLGYDGDPDDRGAVEAFVGTRAGRQFARAGGYRDAAGRHESYDQIGRQIAAQGRVDIDLGMRLAGGGDYDGTNEALVQSVLANRRDSEFAARSTLDPRRSMGEFARHVADRELSGDDWQQADLALMGAPDTDLDRAAVARRRFEHQRFEGTNWLSRFTMANQSETRWLEQSADAVDQRVLDATAAGIAEARRLGIDVEGVEMPTDPRLPDGSWHPAVRRFAMDGDGRLRGNGPLMTSLAGDVEQTAQFYREEIDRQEAFLLSAVTVLAIVASIVLAATGVGLVLSGIIVALVSGAATVAIKSGMRGGRYGWEEMAADVATTAIQAATAGVGGKLSQGARLAGQSGVASGLVGVGRAIGTRYGPKVAPVAIEAATGAASSAATAALDDRLWDDGFGTGLLKVSGRGLQGGLSSGVNAGVSGALTRGMQRRLNPDPTVPQGQGLDRLNRAGRQLGPRGREIVEEVVSNVGGALTGESVNFLADVMVYLAQGQTLAEINRSMGGLKGIGGRFGTAALKEGTTALGKTAARQMHRARYHRMAGVLHREGRDPTPAEAALLARVARAGGLVPETMATADFANAFSRMRVRMADMPQGLRASMQGMDPASAERLVAMMDSGRLGTRAERRAIVNELSLKVPGLQPDAFDRLLLAANTAHRSARQARRHQLAAARTGLLAGVRGPERRALADLDAEPLVGLPPDTVRRLAVVVGEAGADGALDPGALRRLVVGLMPGDPVRARRVAETVQRAMVATAEERAALRTAAARGRDDLMLAAPEALHGTLARLSPRALTRLGQLMRAGDDGALGAAVALIRQADPDRAPQVARALAVQLREGVAAQTARLAHLDNVPPAQRATMAQLPDDILMELRVAQYTRQPPDERRLAAIVATVRATRPGADPAAIRTAIAATLRHPHGRPGLREGLAQKRALLEAVPFGLKRLVLRTPVLTLPDAAFLSHVRGVGNEQAVTLILGGRPVILVRAGADRRALVEEGVHVLQIHDPHWRDRVQHLGERRLAQWDRMTPAEQIAAYRSKMALEIDAQTRIIERLDRRAALSALPGMRARALAELALAEQMLGALRARLDRAEAVTPDAMLRMVGDPALRPPWLRQPARLFNKADADALLAQVMPGADAALAARFRRLSEGLAHADQAALADAVSHAAGKLDPAALARVLDAFGGDVHGDTALLHLADTPPTRIAQRLLAHVAPPDPAATASLRALAETVETRFKGFAGATEATPLIEGLVRALGDVGGGDALGPGQATLRHGLLTQLAALPATTSAAHKTGVLATMAALLGTPPEAGPMLALRNRPDLVAAALSGLAGPRPARGTMTVAAYGALVTGMMQGAMAQADPAAQRAALGCLARNHAKGASHELLTRLAVLMDQIAVLNRGLNPAERLDLSSVVAALDRYPDDAFGRRTRMAEALSVLIANTHGRSVSANAQSRVGETVGGTALTAYLRASLDDQEIGISLRMLASLSAKGQIGDAELTAILNRQPLEPATKTYDFNAAFGEPLNRRDPLFGTQEAYAQHLQATAHATHGVVLSLQESRAIARRVDVLEVSALFSALLGGVRSAADAQRASDLMRTRDEWMTAFFNFARDKVRPDQSTNDRGRAIDEAFRVFVRSAASQNVDEIRAMGRLRVGEGDLDPAARRALIDILQRGDPAVGGPSRDTLATELETSVRAAIEAAKDTMIANYRAAHALDNRTVHFTDAELRALIDQGVFSVERTGKGAMMESLVNALFWAGFHEHVSGDLHALYSVIIAHQSDSAVRATRLTYESIDQIKAQQPGERIRPRSFDHLFEIGETTPRPLQVGDRPVTVGTTDADTVAAMGLATGSRLAVDSKNGSGAFDPNQFRRNVVEMMKRVVEAETGRPSPQTQTGEAPTLMRNRSVFAEQDLAGLLYLSDNATNMFDSHGRAMGILRDIFDTARTSGRIVVTIDGTPHDLTSDFGLTPEMVHRHRDLLRLYFGRIGQVGTATQNRPGQRALGPLAIVEPSLGMPQLIDEILGPSHGVKRP